MGNDLSSKFKKKIKSRSKTKQHTPTVNPHPIPSVKEGKWSWNNNGVWTNFEQITSNQINDSIRIEWDTTSDNPLTFPLTSGGWFSQRTNHNVYSVEVNLNHTRTKITSVYQINKNTNFRRKLKRKPLYIRDNKNINNNDIYNNLLTMGFHKTLAYRASIDCKTLNSAIEYVTGCSLTNNLHYFDKPLDISRYQFVDKRTEYLIFGYIRNLQRKYLTQPNIPIEINQICAIFYFDQHPLKIKLNSKIDAKDRWGKWYLAEIKYHKKANEALPVEPKLGKKQIAEKKRLEKLEGVFIHFLAWEEKWDEWIFIEPNTICTCKAECTAGKHDHRLSAPNTQSLSQRNKKNRNKITNKAYDTVAGEPIAPGCVGLINIGNNSYMNAVIQCIANTPELLPYFITRKYELDLNTSNNQLGMKGKFAREIGKLLIDIWSNNFKMIRPDSLRQSVIHFAPQYGGLKLIDAMKFLYFVLQSLNEELNLIKVKPYVGKIDCDGKSDEIIAQLSWKQHLEKNNSKIVDLFHGLLKYYTTYACGHCKKDTISFKSYKILSLPVKDIPNISFIVDVFHRNPASDPHLPSKPIRHIYHVQKNQRVEDLAKIVANDYDVEYKFVLFFENYNMMVGREWYHKALLGNIPNKESLACCILKDYNKEVTAEEIKKKKLSLWLASVCHSIPLNGCGFSIDSRFGMPFVISFLNIHSRREINKVVYERLHLWLGNDILTKPPILTKLLRVNLDADDEKILTKLLRINLDADAEKYEYEIEWDIILNNLPFTLRVLTNKQCTSSIPCDDTILDLSAQSKDSNFQIVIEWKQEFVDKIKTIINKVVCHKEYSKWKKEKKANPKSDMLTLYECMDDYLSGEVLEKDDELFNQNKTLFRCSDCKENGTNIVESIDSLINEIKCFDGPKKQIEIWSFPKILIMHLNRYRNAWPNYNVSRENARSFEMDKIQTRVDCPINGLDLTKYEMNNNNDMKAIYDLYATVNIFSGHYASAVKNRENDKWYWLNDSDVKCVEQPKINDTTYILFYQRRV